jgi:hypothetical protein
MLDTTKTGVAPVTTPTEPGSTNPSTLDNLAANIAGVISPTDASQGAPAVIPPATTPAPTTPDAATVPKVDDKDAEAEAKAHRLSQDNANLRATLTKMGVDPDGDMAEQLRQGYITFDDIVRTKTTATPAEPKAPAPEVPLNQKLADLQNVLAEQRRNPNNVTGEQYVKTQDKLLEVITDLATANQNISQQQEMSAQNIKAQRMVDAADAVYSKEVGNTIPKDVADIAQEMFLGAVNLEHVSLVGKHGERVDTPQVFGNVAAQVTPKFNQFVQAIFKAGQDEATARITGKQPTSATVNPLTPGIGTGTPPPPEPKDKFDIRNIDKNVEEFLRTIPPNAPLRL